MVPRRDLPSELRMRAVIDGHRVRRVAPSDMVHAEHRRAAACSCALWGIRWTARFHCRITRSSCLSSVSSRTISTALHEFVEAVELPVRMAHVTVQKGQLVILELLEPLIPFNPLK